MTCKTSKAFAKGSFLLMTALLVSALPPSANAASSCTRVGESRTRFGIIEICRPIGGSLQWTSQARPPSTTVRASVVTATQTTKPTTKRVAPKKFRPSSTTVATSRTFEDLVFLATGESYTCSIEVVARAARCWGARFFGQLGTPSASESIRPVAVEIATGPLVSLGLGTTSTCSLSATGGVRCWGDNRNGQLGNGQTSPVSYSDVAGLSSGVLAIATGAGFACAVTEAGGVRCWGFGGQGQLGNGRFYTGDVGSPLPVEVVGLPTGVRSLSSGRDSTCVVTKEGGVKCWGNNVYGNLGDGTNTPRSRPVEVLGLSRGITMVAVGEAFACALTEAGGVLCWGSNSFGQLGDGTIAHSTIFSPATRTAPINVIGLATGVKSISTGSYHTCAVMAQGSVKCWGNNARGQLGNSSLQNSSLPVDVLGLPGPIRLVSAGGSHTCALTENGQAWCWGGNQFGQIGDGTTEFRLQPVRVN